MSDCLVQSYFFKVLSNDTLHDLFSHLKFQSWQQVPLLPVCSTEWRYCQLILYLGFGYQNLLANKYHIVLDERG